MDAQNQIYNSDLLDFGLSPKEIIIYLNLLNAPGLSVLDLSKITKIKRSTAHNVVQSLIDKGLVTEKSKFKSRRRLFAEDPEKLHLLLGQKKWKINELEVALPDIVRTLKKYYF